MALTKEPKDRGNLRHIHRKYHYVQHRVKNGDITVSRVSSKEKYVDPFIKLHDGCDRTIGIRLKGDLM